MEEIVDQSVMGRIEPGGDAVMVGEGDAGVAGLHRFSTDAAFAEPQKVFQPVPLGIVRAEAVGGDEEEVGLVELLGGVCSSCNGVAGGIWTILGKDKAGEQQQ